MGKVKGSWILAGVVAVLCAVMAFIDIAEIPSAPQGLHAKGLVVSVDNTHVRQNMMIKTEPQFLKVRLLNGPHEGQEIDITNTLTGKLEFDEFYEAGMKILVNDLADGKPRYGKARGVYRLDLQLALIVLFAVLLVAVSGTTGLKAMLSFIFTAMVLWKVFFPLLLIGFEPLPTGLATVAIITAVITFSVGGINRRGLATFAGSMMGVLLTCVLAGWFAGAFALSGVIRPYADTLLYSGYYHLKLTDIFIASVFIASSGAVMDLAMDIAATMDEIKRKQPDISMWEHIVSGLRVGRAVVGTMTTTLLLAYSSSHIVMLLLFMSKGLPLSNLLNAPFVAAEILNILVGSFGLVTVAPFTALMAGVIYRKKSMK